VKHELLVDAAAVGKRVDVFVGEKLSLSRAKLKALFEAEAVRVNGRKAKKGLAVALGQRVEIELEEQANTAATADASLTVNVLWEDEALVFVDKPAHIPSQPLKPGELGAVANALASKYPGIEQVSDDPREAGLCHRLDVETSGVLLAAKTRAAWQAMRAQFSSDSRELDKRYLALVVGPLADEGEIDLPLSHHGDSVRPQVTGVDAREARSEFEVLERVGDVALVQVRILTGVLHQVRAHLAAVGAPIVGDALYGGRPIEGLDRFFLHARSLAVAHPTTFQRVKVDSPLPEALRTVLTSLGFSGERLQ
jgi:23S rRNA pseudouridine1911/1915/1917 synthase